MEGLVCSIPTNLIDPFGATAVVEPRSRWESLDTQINSTLVFKADRKPAQAAMTNLIQDMQKYACAGRNFNLQCNLTRELALFQDDNRCASPLSDTAEGFRGPQRVNGIPGEEPTDNPEPGPGRRILVCLERG